MWLNLDFFVDEFEVAIFLRESRVRHSLLTRHKTFENLENPPNKSGVTEGATEGIGESAVNPDPSADAEIIIESDSDLEVGLRNIPQASEDVEEPRESGRSTSPRGARNQLVDEVNNATVDEKKLRFSTRYESFDICGWVLCLLITRKGNKARTSVPRAESRQPLMEEWISTQAQTAVDED